MVAVILVVVSVLALLVYSAFQLYTSKWENKGGQINWLQMVLILVAALDLACIFLPYELIYLGPSYAYVTQTVLFLSAVVPLAVGGWFVNREGPARVSMFAACSILFLSSAFNLLFFSGAFFPRRW